MHAMGIRGRFLPSRRASLLADPDVERLHVLRAECLAGHLDKLPCLNIRNREVVAGEPAHPKICPELHQLAYPVEFVFPARVQRFSEADSAVRR